jgi:hypothetical protein
MKCICRNLFKDTDMKQTIVAVLLTFLAFCSLFGQDARRNYIGTNPFSYLLSLPIDPTTQRFLPILTGNEYGISVVAGRYITPATSVEGRLVLGNVHQVATVGQLHAGINHYFFGNTGNYAGDGPYAGLYLKYWDYHNRLTKKDFHNICPYIAIGYKWTGNRVSFDLRVNQTTVVYSWSDLEATRPAASVFLSPWPEFIRVLPMFSCTLGYRF